MDYLTADPTKTERPTTASRAQPQEAPHNFVDKGDL